MKKLIPLLALLVSLSGCVTTDPTNLDEANFVSPKAQAEKTTENNVKITVVRDHGNLIGSMNSYYVKDNDREIAELKPKDKTVFYTTAGKHRIACAWFTGQGFEHFSVLSPNEEAVFHCGVYGHGLGYINRTE
ncbi:hypothetical protein [Parasutterella muris]|uniref:Lipoprotein n=1 Tax=Parasutterella muris TaxID=2565572 RepID=A0A6L6YJG5_9BURK|nr:hypothetical protein [Parasutterella muris]MVX56853.1 hypothetical protein [Parasutterella muris]